MTPGELLHQLQNLDLELENGQRRMVKIQSSLGETEAVDQTRDALAAAEQEHRKWVVKARGLELEIEGLDDKTAASEKRLYGGSISNPKELSDIQEEIASLKRRCETLEDELLEAMVYGEEAEATLEECRLRLAKVKTQWQAEQTALTEEFGALETRLAEARDERDYFRRTITADDVALYDKVRARYGSVVVETLRDGVCGFCAVAPSSTKLKQIRIARELLQCSNCGHILLAL